MGEEEALSSRIDLATSSLPQQTRQVHRNEKKYTLVVVFPVSIFSEHLALPSLSHPSSVDYPFHS
jgi:hypothetical protein